MIYWQVGTVVRNAFSDKHATVTQIITKEDSAQLKHLYPDLDWDADWEPLFRISYDAHSSTTAHQTDHEQNGWRAVA